MIITCNNCNKKFELDSTFIPDKGRLLQCNGCNHKWFFKKDITNKPLAQVRINQETKIVENLKDQTKSPNIESSENIELLDNFINKDSTIKKVLVNKNDDNDLDNNLKKVPIKNKKKPNILGLIIVFIVSFIALIIILDTFQVPISKIIPNIEFLLYSLYETINDIKLFLIDLI